MNKQKGVATLFVTTILLIAITIFTLNASRMSALELIISTNNESEHTAFNNSESVVDALFSITDTFVDQNKDRGYTYCTAHNPDLSGCNEIGITSANNLPTEFESNKYQAQLTIESKGCAPRWMDTSCDGTITFIQYSLLGKYEDVENNGSSTRSNLGAMDFYF